MNQAIYNKHSAAETPHDFIKDEDLTRYRRFFYRNGQVGNNFFEV